MLRVFLRALGVLFVGAVLVAAWIAIDICTPHQVDIRDFDADEVARLDTAMWRSYYSRQRLKLYCELTELLEKQYKLNFWQRQFMAFRAAKAAFVFKDGESRKDTKRRFRTWRTSTPTSATSARPVSMQIVPLGSNSNGGSSIVSASTILPAAFQRPLPKRRP